MLLRSHPARFSAARCFVFNASFGFWYSRTCTLLKLPMRFATTLAWALPPREAPPAKRTAYPQTNGLPEGKSTAFDEAKRNDMRGAGRSSINPKLQEALGTTGSETVHTHSTGFAGP